MASTSNFCGCRPLCKGLGLLGLVIECGLLSGLYMRHIPEAAGRDGDQRNGSTSVSRARVLAVAIFKIHIRVALMNHFSAFSTAEIVRVVRHQWGKGMSHLKREFCKAHPNQNQCCRICFKNFCVLSFCGWLKNETGSCWMSLRTDPALSSRTDPPGRYVC